MSWTVQMLLMVEGRGSLGLVDEPFLGFWIAGEVRRKKLERDRCGQA